MDILYNLIKKEKKHNLAWLINLSITNTFITEFALVDADDLFFLFF